MSGSARCGVKVWVKGPAEQFDHPRVDQRSKGGGPACGPVLIEFPCCSDGELVIALSIAGRRLVGCPRGFERLATGARVPVRDPTSLLVDRGPVVPLGG